MTAIDRVRQALAMQDADYASIPSSKDVAELLRAFDNSRTVRAEALEAAAQIADSFNCGICGMDGKTAKAIRLFAALPSAPVSLQDHGWQPMDTAPKNATWIIGRVPRGQSYGYPDWRCAVMHWAEGGGDDQPRFGPGWFEDNGFRFIELDRKPTHWMPLDPAAYRPMVAEDAISEGK